jgi:hypothetical protein
MASKDTTPVQLLATYRIIASLSDYRGPFLKSLADSLNNYSINSSFPLSVRTIAKDKTFVAASLFSAAALELDSLAMHSASGEDYTSILSDLQSGSIDSFANFAHNFSTYLRSANDATNSEVISAAHLMLSAKQELSTLADYLRPHIE